MTLPTSPWLAAVAALDPPIDLGREEAQREAVEELLRSGYHQEPLVDRLWRHFTQLLGDLLDGASGGPGGGRIALFVIVAVIALLAALLFWSLRRMSRSRRTPGEALLGGRERTAAEHRTEAERLAAEGSWAEAIRERLRAIARDLEERAVVSPMPGRTAVELAADAGRALPEHAARLSAAARLFDDVTYGEAPGTAAEYASLAELDRRVAAARATLGADA
ncbi:DUF4129 domain-containing protein [Microtetraspora sp. NBRC 16547]|uniref:DUF4129 domain-containing protein n=1 Tax=Microtetraspora sp. NBRC 16547 TaxID=3030993 RepID=UPI0024A31F63|nr:DUF4129 domain-containing protein [Microtetraspora sp. NBRC 16547]GLW96005.1 hypothetical protein Misp02_00920 [Microtetraspora sp. NBRC 16547]